MKKIKLIKFNKPDETVIGFVDSYKALGIEKILAEKTPGVSMDLPRHADFQYAMDRLAPHLLIANGYRKPQDDNGNFLQASHFNNMFFNEDEERENFGGLQVSGIVIKGNDFHDGVIITGLHEAPSGDMVAIKTPSISLLEDPAGYNYPLREILLSQIETLLHEAAEYHGRRKHGAGVQAEIKFTQAAAEKTGDAIEVVIADRKLGKGGNGKKTEKDLAAVV